MKLLRLCPAYYHVVPIRPIQYTIPNHTQFQKLFRCNLPRRSSRRNRDMFAVRIRLELLLRQKLPVIQHNGKTSLKCLIIASLICYRTTCSSNPPV